MHDEKPSFALGFFVRRCPGAFVYDSMFVGFVVSSLRCLWRKN